jgi:putative transposase
MWYHVLSRGNRREAVFYKPGRYDAFVDVIIDARSRLPVHVLGYCLMPNHFHLVIRPQADANLGRWVQRLLMAHARRYHRRYGTSGHVGKDGSRHSSFRTTIISEPYCAT